MPDLSPIHNKMNSLSLFGTISDQIINPTDFLLTYSSTIRVLGFPANPNHFDNILNSRTQKMQNAPYLYDLYIYTDIAGCSSISF